MPRLLNVFALAALPLFACGRSLNDVAGEAELKVREEYRGAMGQDATTSRELLAYLDRHVEGLPPLDDAEADALVQVYGAALGQLLIRDLGGRWVKIGPDRPLQDAVALPNGKSAFVFTRAWRRIKDREPIGFVAFYDSAVSLVNGTSLPPGVETQSTDGG